MWRNGFLFLLAILIGRSINAQQLTSFTVSDNTTFDRVQFSLNASQGTCFIKPGHPSSLMDIKSSSENLHLPKINEQLIGRTKQVNLVLESTNTSSFGSSLTKMFGSSEEDDYTWKVYLSDLKPLNIDLNYAIGDSYIDLSNLPIERLRMRSGSANIKVNYSVGMANKLQMDTFLIKVDMGTFEAKNLHLSNSSHIITDVGFGKVHMDFEGADQFKADVKALVGAGKLEVLLPGRNVPVKININDSPLCQIKIPKEFKMASSNVFVSPGYDENIKNRINFNVDVAVGNIVFK